MRIHRRIRLALTAVTVLAIAGAFLSGGKLFAKEEASSSSECIKCHTDLEKMDSYGAASTGGTAAIAG